MENKGTNQLTVAGIDHEDKLQTTVLFCIAKYKTLLPPLLTSTGKSDGC